MEIEKAQEVVELLRQLHDTEDVKASIEEFKGDIIAYMSARVAFKVRDLPWEEMPSHLNGIAIDELDILLDREIERLKKQLAAL